MAVDSRRGILTRRLLGGQSGPGICVDLPPAARAVANMLAVLRTVLCEEYRVDYNEAGRLQKLGRSEEEAVMNKLSQLENIWMERLSLCAR